jgi:pimeloyl-ACP methyl ester carboxylesterase
VFYGVRDYGPASGAPGNVRVFFPSLDGAVFDAPILEGCCKFPLIVFCHGHCPGDAEHYKKWFEIPAQLARSGYVVAVPQLPQVASGSHPSGADGDLALLESLVAWMRSGWEHAGVVMPAPATGIMGHSFGALLAGRFASNAGLSAYASLSGVWQDWPSGDLPIFSMTMPKLFTWGDDLLDLFTSLDNGGLWGRVPVTKHRAVFPDAAHWDYLRPGKVPCETLRGSCDLVGPLAGDIVAAFFGKYLPPECWPHLPSCIPNSLKAKLRGLSVEQQFFAGGHLMSWSLIASRKGCSVSLGWQTATSTGSKTVP